MAGKQSAGIMLYRRNAGQLEVLLAHMGGPLWARRDEGAWSVPKGEYEDEQPLTAARREFEEELGLPAPSDHLVDLGSSRQSGGKVVTIWAAEGDLDPAQITPGTFEIEWPPRSGRLERFPEIDRVAWLDIESAKAKIVTGQRIFIDRLIEQVDA